MFGGSEVSLLLLASSSPPLRQFLSGTPPSLSRTIDEQLLALSLTRAVPLIPAARAVSGEECSKELLLEGCDWAIASNFERQPASDRALRPFKPAP